MFVIYSSHGEGAAPVLSQQQFVCSKLLVLCTNSKSLHSCAHVQGTGATISCIILRNRCSVARGYFRCEVCNQGFSCTKCECGRLEINGVCSLDLGRDGRHWDSPWPSFSFSVNFSKLITNFWKEALWYVRITANIGSEIVNILN